MSEEYIGNSRMSQFGQKNPFLNPANEAMLTKLVYQDFQRRLGDDLNEKQYTRLQKTVRHYMGEVAQALPEQPLQIKNKEVLSAVVGDFLAYVQRSAAAPPVKEDDVTRMDVATRFSQLQNERNTAKATPPAPPQFRITMEEEGPPALSIFEQVKKAREEETLKGEQKIAQTLRAESDFRDNQAQSNQFDQMVLADRERAKQAAQRNAATEMASRVIPPDPRRIFMKDMLDGNITGQGTPLESILTGQSGLANANMTLALPEAIRLKPALPQETIIRQDDILAYKENEYNLFVYSADRDWVINKNQNRYNFTVNFDPANNGPGLSYAPSATIKFKNITRIELVKTILPIEGLDVIQTVDVSGVSPTYGTGLNVNVLSFPYLNVYIPELDTNNFGTDTYFNQAFASIQYDANWVSDNATVSKGGYLAMIPKFLKCQKVYAPTPLATLRKLSIAIQRPDGCNVSDTLDTLDISDIISSYAFTAAGATTTGTKYADSTGTYIWIQTKTWFSRFTVNQGDRIQMKAIQFPTAYTGNTAAKNDLIEFLQRPEGHLVVAIANEPSAGTFVDGQNSVGYANCIIIRSKMADPTTGSTSVSTFGLLDAGANNTFLNTLYNDNATGRLINLSHQTTLVFRVITRDLDPTTRLRPDNL
jgi:hypothetical protein